MQKVLVDTATLLDLVFYFQERHRRNKQVHSSAVAAIESLIVYENPVLDGSSIDPLLDSAQSTRYLEHFCDSIDRGISQLSDLAMFCESMESTAQKCSEIYVQAANLLDQNLIVVENETDLRAYELYDYLPYHLGEDPTAIECNLKSSTASELADLCGDITTIPREQIQHFCKILEERKHPTRAAWALPLLRLMYYQVLQQQASVHYAPHATKATLCWGRSGETTHSKRLLSYCGTERLRQYRAEMEEQLGAPEFVLPLPAFGVELLHRARDWVSVIKTLQWLRESPPAINYRHLMTQFFDSVNSSAPTSKLGELTRELKTASDEWSKTLSIDQPHQVVRISVPMLPMGNPPMTRGGNSQQRSLMLFHSLIAWEGQ